MALFIGGWLILCSGGIWRRMSGSIPHLYPLDVSGTPPKLWQLEVSLPVDNHWFCSSVSLQKRSCKTVKPHQLPRLVLDWSVWLTPRWHLCGTRPLPGPLSIKILSCWVGVSRRAALSQSDCHLFHPLTNRSCCGPHHWQPAAAAGQTGSPQIRRLKSTPRLQHVPKFGDKALQK